MARNGTNAELTGVVKGPSVLDEFIGYHLRSSWLVVQADLVSALKPLDLRIATFSTLLLIVERPGQMQAKLADTLRVERPNFVAIVEELERRDLITRSRDLEDRRAYCLHATPKGEALLAKAADACRAHEERVFGQLSDEDRKTLDRILRQLKKPATER